MLRRVAWVAAAFVCIHVSAVQGQSSPPESSEPETIAETWLVDASAPVCRQTSALKSCGDAMDPIVAAGPGGTAACCERHLETCTNIICAPCGSIREFNCSDNGRGGCTSTCRCNFCPV